MPMRYAMDLSTASQFGRHFAAHGWSIARIKAWLVMEGYLANGRSFKRILRAYKKQLAAG